MPSTKQAFISGYLEGEIAKMVSAVHVEGILRSASIPEILAAINGTDIGDYLESTSAVNFNDVEEYLWAYLNKCLWILDWFRFVPDDVHKVLRCYVEKYDVFNIKATLWRITDKKVVPLIPLGVVQNQGKLTNLASAEDLNAVALILDECGLKQYAMILRDNEKSAIGGQLRFTVESKLDSQYYARLLDVVSTVGDSKTFMKCFGLIVDLANLQKIFRSVASSIDTELEGTVISGGTLSVEHIRELLSLKFVDIPARLTNTPYGEMAREVVMSYDRTKSITVIDEVVEKYRFRILRENLSLKVMSPLVVLWYLILKEIEIRNMRLVLKGIFDKTPMADIRSFMVVTS